MSKPKPVGVEELKRAILRTIVKEFDGRPRGKNCEARAGTRI